MIKKLYLLLLLIVFSGDLFAQAPHKMTYQAVVRDSSNNPVTNSAVGMQISILQSSPSGTVVYSETQTPVTNAFGLITIEIGGGNVVSGNFVNISWANGPFFLKTETDPAGGTNYSITGTTQLLSVPYALFSGNGVPGGGTSGQILTNCNGVPVWTTGGQCPAIISALNCATALNSGTLTQGIAAGGVSSSVPYTGGNGGSYNAQTVNSTGVTGLTATLASGTFANGSGNLTYTISGTPSASGTASFALNIGGQSCTLTRTVNAAPVYPPGTVFCSGTPTAVVDVTNPATGKTWMDRNLGASQVATSSTDANSYGDLYQWGRRADGHQCRTSTTTTTLSSSDQPTHDFFITAFTGNYDWRSPQNNNLWQGVNGINNPCPSGYRLPTDSELDEESLSWSGYNAAGAFASPLKLPMAGNRYNFGSVSNVDINGFYWSSTVSSTDSRNLFFNSSNANMFTFNRVYGFSVRCLKETTSPPVGTINTLDCNVATNSGTLTQGTAAGGVSTSVPYTGGNGGTYNAQTVNSTGVTGLTATLAAGTFANGAGNLTYTITGTPSASGTASFALSIGGQSCTLNMTVAAAGPSYPSGTVHCSGTPTAVVDVTNPVTGKTWMDRNLGASQAANSSTDTAAYGDLYQWGRGADGHQCRTSTTTTTLSSSDQPGHGFFIIAYSGNYDWRNPQNTNLWQGVNGTNNPCPSGYRLPTDSELDAESLSWGGTGAAGAFASPLKLPMAGRRLNSDGSLNLVGTYGFYWSSTVSSANSRFLHFFSSNAYMSSNYRTFGFSVRCLKETTSPPVGTINTLDCNGATNSGTLTQGIAASGVSSSVPYTGGNGGSYNAQTVNSTGVTGLTATLASGTFANGAGNLTYTITGTPSASGTASFALNIGGQSCTLTRTVNAAPVYPPGTVFCSGTPTAVVDVTNPATGKIWMDRNLGATQVATSSTDANAYGDLYQWGRRSDGHQCRTSNTTTTLSSTDQPAHGNFIIIPPSTSPFDWRNPQNNNLWQGVNGVNNPCPSGYRLPTEIELNAERLSWGGTNAAGAYASPLKLPMAGIRYPFDGLLSGVGTGGTYWSSTVSSTDSRGLIFSSSNAYMDTYGRAHGYSVRCLKETTSPPVGTINTLDCNGATNSGTLTQGIAAGGVSSSVPYTGGNGGSYNAQTVNSTGVTGLTATLASGTFANGAGNLTYTITGTPSASGTASFALNIGGQSCTLTRTVNAAPVYPPGTVFCSGTPTAVVDVTNPVTGKTWMDRNLGASQAANSSTDTAAYGDLYQWGRGADGHQCRTSTTTTTLSSSDQPGHGFFIIADYLYSGNYDWRNPQNNNLWQGVNGTNNPCPSGYRLPTDSELDAESLSWGGTGAAGAYASPLKLPVAGMRFGSDGLLSGVGISASGFYWSSTVSSTYSHSLGFFGSSANMVGASTRADGLSVRCLKD